MYNLEELTIARFHESLKQGEITCEGLIHAYLQRIEVVDRRVNSIITVNPAALDRARELDVAYAKGGLVGPLHGVPVLLKDNCETHDMPTTMGSKCLEGWQSGKDSYVARKLRDAGAIILAKTNLHEFAMWGETVGSLVGQTYNPYDFTRTPGGSSGGTGAALAANLGIVGIGTDTGQSVRSPASACAVCGLRPTTGLIDTFGIMAYSHTQDAVGPMARTVEDTVRVLDVLAGGGQRPTSYIEYLKPDGLRGKRIGLIESFWGAEKINRPVNDVIRGAMDILRGAGAELISISEYIDSDYVIQQISVQMYELRANFAEYMEPFGKHTPVRSIGDIIESGKYVPAIEKLLHTVNGLSMDDTEYYKRLQRIEETKVKMREIMERESLDAFAFPHQQQLVCKVGGSQLQRNGVLASVIGWPSISVPAGFSAPDDHAPIGVPVGLEIITRANDEAGLLQIAYGFEQAGHYRRKPVLELD